MSERKAMTESQKRVYDAYLSFWQAFMFCPTFRKVAEILGMHKSGNGVHAIVKNLVEMGWMIRETPRVVRPVDYVSSGQSSNAIAADGVSVAIVGDMVVFMLFDGDQILESGLYTVEQVSGWCQSYKIPGNSLAEKAFNLGKGRLAKLKK